MAIYTPESQAGATDTAKFQAAIDAANAAGGGVVQASGSYTLLEVVLKSNVIIDLRGGRVTKGTTSTATTFVFKTSPTVAASSSVTANVSLNTQTVTVSSGASFAVGDIVKLYDNTYAYTTNGRNQELNRVTAVSSNTITLATPTINSYATASSATLAKMSTVENCQIIGGKITNPSGNYGGLVKFETSMNCSIAETEMVGAYHFPAVLITTAAAYTRMVNCIVRDGQGMVSGNDYGHGVEVDESAYDVVIDGNTFTNYNQNPLTNAARMINFTNNICVGAVDNGVNTHGSGCVNILIANNQFISMRQYGITIGFSTHNAADKYVTIKGNQFNGVNSHAICVNAPSGKENQFVTVEGNIIKNFGLTAASTGAAGVLVGNAKHVTVNGNIIDGNSVAGAYYGIEITSSTDVMVHDNKVANNTNAYGIYCGSVTRGIFSGNMVTNCASYNYYFDSAAPNTSVRLHGNFADDTTATIDSGTTAADNNF